MESFVERFRAKATKARQAQSRLKALERMQRIAPAHVDSPFEFSFAAAGKAAAAAAGAREAVGGYGGRAVLENVSLTLAPGDRSGLLGRNGAGKSTLMKLLAGELAGAGAASAPKRAICASATSPSISSNSSRRSDSPLHEPATRRRPSAPRARPSRSCGTSSAGFGFRGDRVFEPVGPFSGGEKARLVLALVAYLRPNLLLLDEPTNHLDLEMRQALAVALQDYEGAVVLVSHDRHLLRTVADEFHRRASTAAHEPFDGDLDDYARWLDQTHEESWQPHRGGTTPAQYASRDR